MLEPVQLGPQCTATPRNVQLRPHFKGTLPPPNLFNLDITLQGTPLDMFNFDLTVHGPSPPHFCPILSPFPHTITFYPGSWQAAVSHPTGMLPCTCVRVCYVFVWIECEWLWVVFFCRRLQYVELKKMYHCSYFYSAIRTEAALRTYCGHQMLVLRFHSHATKW